MDPEYKIIHGMAVVLWGDCWANHAEEYSCVNLSGVKIEAAMPSIPKEAYNLAYRLTGKLEEANNTSLLVLLHRAAVADEVTEFESDNWNIPDDYCEIFGNHLAFMALRHGVSWFDDHEEFSLKVPEIENYSLEDLAAETCHHCNKAMKDIF